MLQGYTVANAVENAVASRVDLSRADLRGCDLSCCNLRGAILFRAELAGAKFRGADLSDALLQYANCEGADFSHADCRRARFDRAQFAGANFLFERTKLAGASFGGCDLGSTRGDFWRLLSEMPDGVAFLRFALKNGGLVGPASLSRALALGGEALSTPYIPPETVLRPCELFAASLGLGDTPTNHPLARLLLQWIDSWPLGRFQGQRVSDFLRPRGRETSLMYLATRVL